MELPAELQAAINTELTSVPARRLAALVAELSDRYRMGQAPRGGVRSGRFLQSAEDVTAYAAFRLPPIFVAVHAALRQVQERLPDWSPSTLLDVGAGPGTAMWAAAALWPQALKEITLLERNEDMIALGRRLAACSLLSPVREAKWQRADLLGEWTAAPHDLVIASYVLGELPADRGLAVIRRLWDLTRHTLVIVEPGTPAGFLRIKEARGHLLAAGGATVAPCPHDQPCPLADQDWCHFSQRLARSRLHRQVKAGELSYEDEKFSFVALSRLPGTPIGARVVRHPQSRPGHIHLDICTPAGISRRTVTRKDKQQFRLARNLQWGSSLPPDDRT